MRDRRAGRLGRALTALCAVLWTGVASAQEPVGDPARDVREEGAIRETLTVRETTLHVRVRTPRRAVEELTQDRFRVLFGERELPILAFEELDFTDSRAKRSDPAESAPPDGRAPAVSSGRSVLILVDQLFTPRPYLADTAQAVRKNLDRFVDGDRIALMTLGVHAQLVHHFTSDRRVIMAGLDLLEASADGDGRGIRERVATLQQLVDADPSYATPSAIGLRGALGIATSRNVRFTALADDNLFAGRAAARFDTGEGSVFENADASNINALAQLLQFRNESLSEALRLVSDVPAPRYSMLFSGGVGEFRQILSVQGPNALGSTHGAGSSTLGTYQSLSYVLQGFGWTVQSFDVSGVGERSQEFRMDGSGPRSQNSEQIAALPDLALRGGLADASNDTLFFLAEETGGDFYNQFNSIGGVLRDSIEATSHHYRLVVRLEASEQELDRRRTLTVEIADLPRKARVTHSLAADWVMPPNLRREDAVESTRRQLLSGRSEAALPLDVAQLGVFLAPLSDSSRRAVVVLDANARALSRLLRPTDGEYRLRVHALAMPIDPVQGEPSMFLDLFEVDAAWPTASATPTSRLSVMGDLVVPCSGAIVRLRFADPAAAQGVVREHWVPDTCDRQIAWATPLLQGDEDLLIATEEEFEVDDAESNPFVHGGRNVTPDLRRMVQRGEALTVLASGSPDTLLLRRESVGGQTALDAEVTQELEGDARLLTTRVEAQAGLYRLGTAATSSGALVRVLDFGSQSQASPPP